MCLSESVRVAFLSFFLRWSYHLRDFFKSLFDRIK